MKLKENQRVGAWDSTTAALAVIVTSESGLPPMSLPVADARTVGFNRNFLRLFLRDLVTVHSRQKFKRVHSLPVEMIATRYSRGEVDLKSKYIAVTCLSAIEYQAGLEEGLGTVTITGLPEIPNLDIVKIRMISIPQ